MTKKQRELEERNKTLVVENWNLQHRELPVKVYFWTGAREGQGRIGEAYSRAMILGGHTPVVYIRDMAGKNVGCVSLSHVEEIPPETA